MRRAILLIDHGSRLPDAHAMLVQVAGLVRARAAEGTVVEVAHMELGSPTISEGFEACVRAGAELVVAMPYMISAGRHAAEDIPAMVAAAAARHPGVRHRVAGPLGVHPLLAEIVLARCADPEDDPVR